MKKPDDNLGTAIRKRREYVNLKVYELERKAGVNPVYITQIEKHGKLPSPVIMKRISSILHDKRLFHKYLKMKYPMVSSKASTWEIYPGFKSSGEGFLNELRKIRETLERIEKRIN